MIDHIDFSSSAVLLFVLISYLLGSIPFGLIVTRFAGINDIRSIGSGNIGATNVLRSGKKGLAAITLLLDCGKGFLVVYLAKKFSEFSDGNLTSLIVGFTCVIGHIFPIWLKFKGGKGVATTIGVLLGTDLITGIIVCTVWFVVAALSRYSSLAALLAILTAAIYAFLIGMYPLMITALSFTVLSIYCHRDNIERLFKGQEPKIGQ